MEEKEGFTGIRDLDAELLLKMGDREFIRTCGLNNYFIDLCKRDNYLLFKRKLQLFYPDTLEENMLRKYKNESWKEYYAQVVRSVAVLKEKYNYDFVSGNPFIQLKMFKVNRIGGNTMYRSIFSHAIKKNQLSLAIYALRQVPNIVIDDQHLFNALKLLPDMKILKFLISQGANIKHIKEIALDYFKHKNYSSYLELL